MWIDEYHDNMDSTKTEHELSVSEREKLLMLILGLINFVLLLCLVGHNVLMLS
jgi:hypothetical protein